MKKNTASARSPFKLIKPIALTLVSVFASAASSIAATATWDGGGADDFTATAENWVGDVAPSPGTATDYTFSGTTRLTPNITANAPAGVMASSVTFDSTAGAFVISPTAFATTQRYNMAVDGAFIAQNSPNDQTIGNIYAGFTTSGTVMVNGTGAGVLTLSNVRFGSNITLALNHDTILAATNRTASATGQIVEVGGGAKVTVTVQLIPQINVQVTDGTLQVNTPTDSGSVNVDVGANGTLAGTGQLRPGSTYNIEVASGGTVAPGDGGIGTLTLSGASTAATLLSLASGAKFAFDLDSEGIGSRLSDKLVLTSGSAGDISFGGNVINFIDLSGGSLDPGVYTLFTATTANNYAGLAFDGSNYITAGLTIGTGLSSYPGSSLQLVGNDIVLNVVAVPEPATWSFIMAGLGALMIFERRCRKNRSTASAR
jgi:hypothetical protein